MYSTVQMYSYRCTVTLEFRREELRWSLKCKWCCMLLLCRGNSTRVTEYKQQTAPTFGWNPTWICNPFFHYFCILFHLLDLNCPWKFEFLLVCILVIFIINPIWHGSGYIFIPLSLLDYILSVTGLWNRNLWARTHFSPRDTLVPGTF